MTNVTITREIYRKPEEEMCRRPDKEKISGLSLRPRSMIIWECWSKVGDKAVLLLLFILYYNKGMFQSMYNLFQQRRSKALVDIFPH